MDKRFHKKEALGLKREMEKLDRSLGGIKNMEGIPDAILVIDVGHEKGNETISRADKALYHSKESGRNMVSFHDGSKSSSHTKP